MSSAAYLGERLNEEPKASQLRWDIGTAYDFFMSLHVLQYPEEFSLRPSWAAGVRSRLPAEGRKLLEDISRFLWVPISWIYTLPAPKDAATAIWSLRQIQPAKRPVALSNLYESSPDMIQVMNKIADTRSWDAQDLEAIKRELSHDKTLNLNKYLPIYLDWWSRPDELGDLYLSTLEAYYEAFFEEEEKRIAPVLREGLAEAQDLAERLPVAQLLEELSQGVDFEKTLGSSNLVMIPGYWNTPLVLFPKIGTELTAFMFGVRPPDMSLMPGEPVPDTLLRMLKALADPTRLRILHFLSNDNLTPAQLSRRLRLRAPTVTHHLSVLRIAGLVHLKVEAGGEKLYAARIEAIRGIGSLLENYLSSVGAEDESAREDI